MNFSNSFKDINANVILHAFNIFDGDIFLKRIPDNNIFHNA